MPEDLERLKRELQTLSGEERAELAHFLLRSLDDEEDAEAAAAWDVVLTQRAAEIESGQAVGKPAAQVFAELREKYA